MTFTFGSKGFDRFNMENIHTRSLTGNGPAASRHLFNSGDTEDNGMEYRVKGDQTHVPPYSLI